MGKKSKSKTKSKINIKKFKGVAQVKRAKTKKQFKKQIRKKGVGALSNNNSGSNSRNNYNLMIPLRGWKSNMMGKINPTQQGRFHTQEFADQSSNRCKYITKKKRNSHTEKGLSLKVNGSESIYDVCASINSIIEDVADLIKNIRNERKKNGPMKNTKNIIDDYEATPIVRELLKNDCLYDTIILERIPEEITFDEHYDTSKDEQFGNKMLNLKTRFNRLLNFHGNAGFTESDGKVISLQLQKLG